jgi:hypothetical protein
MAQAGYTPILIYASGTATNIPTAGNLISGSSGAELAINYADGKLYYKDGSGNVKLLSIGYGSSSVTPTNGGVQYGTGTALALTAAGSSGQILRSNGAAAPTWADLSTLGVNTISFGTTGLTPNSATAGAVTVAGTLATTNGGTGLTSFTSGQVFYASSSSAVGQSSNLQFSGTDLTVYGITVGRGAGAVSTNTAVGASALGANTTGSNNTSVGNQSLFQNTTATDNIAVGNLAGYGITSGGFNISIGSLSLRGNSGAVTGSSNIAIGYASAYRLTSGASNVLVGDYTGQNISSGTNNTAVGYQALQANTTASNNTAVGFRAGYSNQTGQGNTFIGRDVGYNTTGGSNTFIGFNDNLGYGAGQLVTTGSKNTILGGYNGNQSGLDIRTVSNNIVISDGDGEPRILYYNAAPMTKISGVLTHNFTDTQSKSQINLYDNTNGNTEIASGYSTADFVVATGGTTGNLSYSARFNGYFVTNTGVVALINTTFTVGSNTYTVTASSSEGYIYCTPDPIGEAATGTLVGVKYATEGFRVLDNRTARFRSTVGVGDTVGATSGAGITFPATQSASSDANTLDDYEEGTWTPVLTEAGTNRTPTYQSQGGRYVKIGNTVYCQFGIALTNKGSGSGSGQIRIEGLPFTGASYGSYQEPTVKFFGGGFTTATTVNSLLQVPGGTAYLRGWLADNAGANVGATATPYTEVTDNSYFVGEIFYNV